ncbi:lactaldehyde reductase [Gardnerella vaginalis]
MVYRMIFNQTAYFGRGAIKEIPNVAKAHGFKKAFVVTDPVLVKTGTVKKVTDVLESAGLPYEVFDNVKPNPPVECIQDGVEKFKVSGADFLIGLGGGSPQDTCKGIGIIVANPEFGDVLSLEGVADTKNPSVPIFGVPTTAGTASETTINYVVTDTAKLRKFVAVDPHDIPIVAFVDPDLTDSMPRSLKVATGLDALTHAIEGFITPGAWSLSDCLSLQTIRMIAQNLAKSADGDVPAGEQMAYASYITGMAYSNVGLGLVHGMAHPLGGRLGVAHGVANGILLAPVMEYNKDYSGEKYRDIAAAFDVPNAYTDDLETVRNAAVKAVHDLTVKLGNPTKISEVGATQADIEGLSHDALADVCTPGNPRKATL